jgi:hypothetical protein
LRPHPESKPPSHLGGGESRAANPRYKLLGQALIARRGLRNQSDDANEIEATSGGSVVGGAARRACLSVRVAGSIVSLSHCLIVSLCKGSSRNMAVQIDARDLSRLNAKTLRH